MSITHRITHARASRGAPTFAAVLLLAVGLALTAALAGGCGADDPAQAPATVSIVQLAPPAMLAAMQAGEIDGFVAWEPFPSMAAAGGYGSYLVRSGETWADHPCCVVAVLPDQVATPVVDALLWAHVMAGRFLSDPANAEAVAAYAAEFTGASPEVVTSALAGMAFEEDVADEDLERFLSQMREQDLIRLPADEEADFWRRFLQFGELRAIQTALDEDPGWAPPPVSQDRPLRMAYIAKDLHQLAVYVARREGYYARVGLEPGVTLELQPYPNGVAIMQAFQAGEIDAAYLGVAPALLKSVNDGVGITVLAGANVEGSALVARAGAGIDSVEDLTGRVVAVPQVGTVQYVLLRDILAGHGMVGRLE